MLLLQRVKEAKSQLFVQRCYKMNNEDKVIDSEEFLNEKDESLTAPIEETDNKPLKKLIVDYVGQKLKPDNKTINVEMIAGVLAEEFPEFLFAIAQENWLRGYQQAMTDSLAVKEKVGNELTASQTTNGEQNT